MLGLHLQRICGESHSPMTFLYAELQECRQNVLGQTHTQAQSNTGERQVTEQVWGAPAFPILVQSWAQLLPVPLGPAHWTFWVTWETTVFCFM